MRPSRSYLVCATPRSGSTLLCKDLLNIGLAGHPKEYFEALKRSGLPRRPIEYFESFNNLIHPLTIVYKDFVPAQEAIISSILSYLDIAVPKNFTFTPRRMKRQADELSEEWVQMYMQY